MPLAPRCRPALPVLAALACAHVLAPRTAQACGASSAGGVSSCSLDEHAWEVAPKWRAGVAGAFTSTSLRFGDVHVEQRRSVLVASLDRRLSPRTTLQLGLGTIAAGNLDVGGARFDLQPGLAVSAGLVHRFVDASGARPFVLGGAQLAVLATSTHGPAGDTQAYEATDLRLTGAVGWTLARHVSPYAVARAFGGPIWWRIDGETKTGTDAYHVQLGAGLVVSGGGFDLGLEGVPLGERGASATLGVAF